MNSHERATPHPSPLTGRPEPMQPIPVLVVLFIGAGAALVAISPAILAWLIK